MKVTKIGKPSKWDEIKDSFLDCGLSCDAER